MTLVRFNHPRVANTLANRAWFESFADSNLDSVFNTKKSDVDYRIQENESSIELVMAMPGLTKENLEIVLDNNMINIKLNENVDEETKIFVPQGFEKQFKVSKMIDVEKITAKVENGVLLMEFPKIEQAIKKPARNIEIV